MSKLGDAIDRYDKKQGTLPDATLMVNAARLVDNPVAVKTATLLMDNDGKQQWVVTVLVDGPGDYMLVTPPGDD